MMKTKLIPAVCLALALSLCAGCGEKTEISSSSEVSSAAASDSAESTPAPSPAFAIEVPDGFTESEMPGTLAYYTSEDGAVISLTTSAKDPDFSTPDVDALVGALHPVYSEQLREDNMQIKVVSTTDDPVCGFPAYQAELKCTGTGYEFSQLFVGIDADMTYTWVFTGSDEQMELFHKCAESITNTVDL